MKIKVVKTELNTQIEKRGGGTYPGHKVVYEDGGEVRSKGFHEKALSYKPEIKEAIESMEADKWYDVQMEKNDNGYWDWVSVSESSGDAPAKSKAPAKSQGYDTTGVAIGHALTNAVHIGVGTGDLDKASLKKNAYMVYDLSIEMQDEIRNGTREDQSEF